MQMWFGMKSTQYTIIRISPIPQAVFQQIWSRYSWYSEVLFSCIQSSPLRSFKRNKCERWWRGRKRTEERILLPAFRIWCCVDGSSSDCCRLCVLDKLWAFARQTPTQQQQQQQQRFCLDSQLSLSSSAFGTALYRRLAYGNHDNIIVSPLSVYTALTMIIPAAAGDTERELDVCPLLVCCYCLNVLLFNWRLLYL